MARPVAVDPHDRRRSPSQRRTSLSHQLRRTPGEKQRPRSYKPPGQTVNTADSARTMSGALGTGPPSLAMYWFSLPALTRARVWGIEDRQLWRGFGLRLGRSARVGGQRAVAWARAARVLFRSHDAARHAGNSDLAVLLERAHLRNGACPNPLPRQFVDLLKRRNCERDVLADHLPILRGRSRHEFDVDVPLGNVAQPRTLVQGTDISRGSAPKHIRPVRVGWRHHRLGRDCLHGDRRPRVFLGLDPY